VNARPKRRIIGIVAQFDGGHAERFPSADFLRAFRATGGVSFERGPFRNRTVFKNPVAIVASHFQIGAGVVHRVHRAPAASALRGGSSIWRRFFFAWKSVFFDAASEISRVAPISAWLKPSTS